MKRQVDSRIWIAAVLSVMLGLTGCTADFGAGAGNGTPSPAASTASVPDPDDVPPDTTDYSKDAGNEPQAYEYEEEPPPAESVVHTLCNLNQVYFDGLRTVNSGTPIVDDKLRRSVVGLTDLLDYWDTLRTQFPDAVDDIDAGIAIAQKWDEALLSRENGDDAAADKAMASAEKLVAELPKEAAADCVQ